MILLDTKILEQINGIEKEGDLHYSIEIDDKVIVYKAWLSDSTFMPVYSIRIDGVNLFYNCDMTNNVKTFFIELVRTEWKYRDKIRTHATDDACVWLKAFEKEMEKQL